MVQDTAERLKAEARRLQEAEQTYGILSSVADDKRAKLRDAGAELILNDFPKAQREGVEHLVWKTTCHKPLGALRGEVENAHKRGTGVKRSLARLHKFLDAAERYYEHLSSRLTAGLAGRDHNPRVAVSRCYAALGDLARYRQMYRNGKPEDKDWQSPASWYNRALGANPGAGNPRNQLAVLATYVGNDISAVFHYYAALVCQQPFNAANSNVQMLFQRCKPHYTRFARDTRLRGKSGGVSFGGALANRGRQELLRSLAKHSFLRVQEAAFTCSSGAEPEEATSFFHAAVDEIVRSDTEWLCSEDPLAQGPTLAFELVSAALCGLELAGNGAEQAGQGEIDEGRELALECAHCIAGRVATLAEESFSSSPASLESVQRLLPALVAFFEFAACRKGCRAHLAHLRGQSSVWHSLASLLNAVATALPSRLEDVPMTLEGAPALAEDWALCGLSPLQGLHSQLLYGVEGLDHPATVSEARISRLVALGRMLASLPDGPLQIKDSAFFTREDGILSAPSRSSAPPGWNRPASPGRRHDHEEDDDYDNEPDEELRELESEWLSFGLYGGNVKTDASATTNGKSLPAKENGEAEEQSPSIAHEVAAKEDEDGVDDEEEIVWDPCHEGDGAAQLLQEVDEQRGRMLTEGSSPPQATSNHAQAFLDQNSGFHGVLWGSFFTAHGGPDPFARSDNPPAPS